MSETEKNKTEEATPFKLKRARDKGQVARGTDLGFFSSMAALSVLGFLLLPRLENELTAGLRRLWLSAMSGLSDPASLLPVIADHYRQVASPLLVFGACVFLTVAVLEVFQVGGIKFTPHPLKPDFKRLDPGKGLKRIVSAQMMKQTLKNIIKLCAYTLAAGIVLYGAVTQFAGVMNSAQDLTGAMRVAGFRLLFTFLVLALVFALIDQVVSRQEFRKQMRMSRSELTREHKEREGEPRMKQKRRKLHADFTKQMQGAGRMRGSDMLIVNPEHYAVALRYDAATMAAPEVTAKGRNRFALRLKSEALRQGIPTLADPPLARALFRASDPGQPIPGSLYEAVAGKYVLLRENARRAEEGTPV